VSLSDERPIPEGEERRVDPRAPIDEPASAKILHPAVSSSDRVDGRVVNLSRSGLKLRLPLPMLPGTIVQVRFMDRIALGEIRYCIPTGSEFYVGVRFQDVMEMP
jgi:PilZ domain